MAPWPLGSTQCLLRRTWQSIIAIVQHIRLDDISCGMPSWTLASSSGRTTSAWHVIVSLGQHTRSNDIGLGNPSSQLCSTRSWMTSRVACPPGLWIAHPVERRLRGISSCPLATTRLDNNCQCYHHPWVAYTVGRRWASNVTISLWRTQMVGRRRRVMPSSPFDYTHL